MTNFNDLWAPTNDAIGAGIFDPQGSNWLNPLPSIPSTFAPSATTPGAKITSTGSGASIPNLNLNTFAPANAQGTPVNNKLAPTAASGSGSVADYFLRGIIVVLGFIFVAVGLHSLAPAVIPDVRNVVRR